MNWDKFWYEAEAVGATVGATIMGGPEAGAATAMYYKGKMDKAEARKERKNHFVNLRNSATRAGFNPLTVLYATGGGGYGQYVGLISRNPLGDALVAGSNAYTAGAARREQMAHDVDMSERAYANEKSLQRMREKAQIKLTRLQQDALGDDLSPKSQPLYHKDGTPMLDDEGNQIFSHEMGREAQPKWIMVRDQVTKELYPYPNPELADIGPTEMAMFMAMQPVFQAISRDGGTGSFKLPGWMGSFGNLEMGIPADPAGIKDIRYPNQNNAPRGFTFSRN
jgi:hypothetical protein